MPTNQSGLGPIIDSRVTSGWSEVRSIENVAPPVPPNWTLSLMTVATSGEARNSDSNLPVKPVSATCSTPREAWPPGRQNVTPPSWAAPISVVKCASPWTPPGVLSRVQLPSNFTS